MVYIFNKYVSPKRTIRNALTSIFGVNAKRAVKILNALRFNPNYRLYEFTPTQISRLSRYISTNYRMGSLLQRQINDDINKLIQIRCFRGFRHRNRLPVRGQRTHTNAKTQRKCGVLPRV